MPPGRHRVELSDFALDERAFEPEVGEREAEALLQRHRGRVCAQGGVIRKPASRGLTLSLIAGDAGSAPCRVSDSRCGLVVLGQRIDAVGRGGHGGGRDDQSGERHHGGDHSEQGGG